MSNSKFLAAGVAIAALAAVAAQPALAQSAKADEASKTSTPAVAEAQALRVVRDADTKQLRPATAAEVDAMAKATALQQRAMSIAAPQTTMAKGHVSGARGARLTDEFAHHSVLVRNADGSMSMLCVGADGVAHAVHNPLPAKQAATAPKLETE